jgi:hypothetical protein
MARLLQRCFQRALALALSCQLLACGAPLLEAPARSQAFVLPPGTEARLLRLTVPRSFEADEAAQVACPQSCEEFARVESSYHSCLARCPGAEFAWQQDCRGVNPELVCVARVVAVPLPPQDAQQASVAEETALAVVSSVLVLSAYALAIGMCAAYSSDPDCLGWDPPLRGPNPGQVRW